jgi:hypothetical protein
MGCRLGKRRKHGSHTAEQFSALFRNRALFDAVAAGTFET